MERVNGIGGVSFRTKDPGSLSERHADDLGVANASEELRRQEADPTVFAPFAEDARYFGRPEQQ